MSEAFLCVMQAGTDSADGDSGDLGDLCVAEVVAESQCEHFALRRWHLAHGSVEPCGVDVVERGRQGLFVGIGADCFERNVDEQLAFATMPAQPIEGAMARAAEQPHGKCRRVSKTGEVAIHGEPGLLPDVLGVVADDAAEVAQQAVAPGLDGLRRRGTSAPGDDDPALAPMLMLEKWIATRELHACQSAVQHLKAGKSGNGGLDFVVRCACW